MTKIVAVMILTKELINNLVKKRKVQFAKDRSFINKNFKRILSEITDYLLEYGQLDAGRIEFSKDRPLLNQKSFVLIERILTEYAIEKEKLDDTDLEWIGGRFYLTVMGISLVFQNVMGSIDVFLDESKEAPEWRHELAFSEIDVWKWWEEQ